MGTNRTALDLRRIKNKKKPWHPRSESFVWTSPLACFSPAVGFTRLRPRFLICPPEFDGGAADAACNKTCVRITVRVLWVLTRRGGGERDIEARGRRRRRRRVRERI